MRLGPVVVAIICVLGGALLLYPTAAAWFSQYAQSQRIEDYSTEIHDLGAQTLRQQVVRAESYNARLSGTGAEIAANERLPLANAAAAQAGYDDLLRADEEGMMARVMIPAIDVDLPVYHGTGEWVLERGIGHLEGTALPVGGPSTHAVLTGHRGLATAELFTRLDRLREGDTFAIQVFGEVLSYRIVSTAVVEPDETQSLLPIDGRDLVTLVTCTPLGINSHRILVTGERIIPTPPADRDAAGSQPDIPSFPWWVFPAGGVLALATAYVWWEGRPVRAATGVRTSRAGRRRR